MKPILLITLAVTTAIATARIGETPRECAKRYGPAVEINKETQTAVFKKAGFVLHIDFLNGKAARVIIHKDEQDALESFTEMSDTEISTLLKANQGKGKFTKEQRLIDYNPRWHNKKATRSALYYSIENYLVIGTQVWMDKNLESKKAAEKKNLEGF